jgi:glycosyltransferase 2 family protein
MRFGWRGVLGLLISALALWWTLRDVEIGAVLAHVRAGSLWLMLLSTVAATGIFPLRARRWRPILHAVRANIPFGPLWRSTAIGMMASNVLPARVGEVARAFALSREERSVRFTSAFASVAVDRVFDALVVLLLMFIAMLDPRFRAGTLVAGQPATYWVGGGAIFVVAVLTALYLVLFFPARIILIFERITSGVSPRVAERGGAILLSFSQGLDVLRTPGRFMAVLGWTLAHWLLNAFAFWLMFRAFGIEAPFSAALFLQGIIAIGVAIPAAPGFFGVFEAFAKAGLKVYGVPEDLAVAWGFTFHFLSFIPITAMGAWYFVRLGIHMDDIGSAAEGRKE